LKVLLRNFVLSDDIAFRFSNKDWIAWPLTADKYAGWINKLAPTSELLNIFLDYETFGEHNWKESGIFDFLQHMPAAILKKTPFKFMTPSEVADKLLPVSAINIQNPISWADEERDITAWLGNELQAAALEKLYSLSRKVNKCENDQLKKDWEYLQSSDHFYYMATKFFSDGAVHAYFNPYESPYDAFMNYMNVLSDFEIRLRREFPDTAEQDQIYKLGTQVIEKDMLIDKQVDEIEKLKKKLARVKPAAKRVVKKPLKEAEIIIEWDKPVKKTVKKSETKPAAKSTPAAKKKSVKEVKAVPEKITKTKVTKTIKTGIKKSPAKKEPTVKKEKIISVPAKGRKKSK
jgi:alpha-amylase